MGYKNVTREGVGIRVMRWRHYRSRGKNIKAYTNQSRHYNQSADIRRKLGLTESDTNLSIFLRDMLEK